MDLHVNWTLVVAVLAIVPTFVTAIILPFGRWLAGRWRGPYVAERDLRRRLEAELLESEKRSALLEVKLKWCEGELESHRPGNEGG